MASLTGCSPKVVVKTEYREVKVPIKCSVTRPSRPAYNPDPVLGVVDILEYCEKLEVLLRGCTEGDKK